MVRLLLLLSELASFDRFRGNAWITLVSGGGNWELRTTANLTRRSDTGQVNSSPVSAMQPIVRIQHGCNASIAIPGNEFHSYLIVIDTSVFFVIKLKAQ